MPQARIKMPTDIENWLEKEGEKFLKEIGIKEGYTILDFGCGEGNYSLPAAKVVGERGKVFALDKSEFKLTELLKKARLAGLKNIKTIETKGELKIPLNDESVDVVLFYDILHSYYFSTNERKKLLKEAYRVLKPDGFLSIYPEHIGLKEIKEEAKKANFYFEKKYFKKLIHEYSYTNGYILNFTKI